MRTFIKKRISIMAIGIMAALLVVAGVGFYMYAPTNMIALDINPSIELHTNRLNRVVSINPVNEDAIRLMTGYRLDDRDLDTVIEDIVDRMIFNGYLTEGQENKILITADDTNTSEELLSRVNSVIGIYLQAKQMKVQLLQQNIVVTKDEEEVAHANNVSAGKMVIIDKLLENSNGLTTEELASTSIKELIQFSIDQNISLEDLLEDNQIDVLSSATIKTETSVLEKGADVSKNDTVVGNEKVRIDAISSATVKTDAEVSGKGEYADAKTEDKEDYDQEDDNDYEDNDNDYEVNDNDYEDNDNDNEDNEDYDIEDKEDQDDSDEQDRNEVVSYRNESDSDDSEEDEYSYSREEDNDDDSDDDSDDNGEDEGNSYEDHRGEDNNGEED